MNETNARVSPTGRPEARALPDKSAALRSETGLDPHYLFYCYTCGQNAGGNESDENGGEENVLNRVAGGGLQAPYGWTTWRPRSWSALPHGLPSLRLRLRFLFRWAVQRLRLFAGPGCGALLIYDREQLVHYSGFTPGYWRFPFVTGEDFQIGHTWTHPAHRGRGLALFALQKIVMTLTRPGRRFWYVVEVTNESSIRVAMKAQFILRGEGTWVMPWGFKLAGAYVIRNAF